MTPVINHTLSYEPESTATVVVAAIGVGIVSVATLGLTAYYLLKKRPPMGAVVLPSAIHNNNRHQGGDNTCKIEIASADLKEIEALLIEHRKEFKVL